MIRKFFLSISLAASATAAVSADLPSTKGPAPFVAPVPAFTWTGLYVGINGGYNWSQSKDTVSGANPATITGWLYPGEIGSPVLNPSGVIGGAQIGFNSQIAPSVVAGVEADLAASGLKSTVSIAGTLDNSRLITGTEKMDVFGTLRGRIGYTPIPQLLAYLTGGLAFGHASLSTGLTRPGFSPPPAPPNGCGGANNCQSGSVSVTRLGWTLGAGAEWAITNSWSLKAEYLYYDLGSMSHLMTDLAFPATVFLARAPLRGNIVRVGVNLKL